MSADNWEGSNQSYEDGGGSSSGTGVVASAGDPLSMPLPLHSDIAESSQLHDSSRVSVDSFCMSLSTLVFALPLFTGNNMISITGSYKDCTHSLIIRKLNALGKEFH